MGLICRHGWGWGRVDEMTCAGRIYVDRTREAVGALQSWQDEQ